MKRPIFKTVAALFSSALAGCLILASPSAVADPAPAQGNLIIHKYALTNEESVTYSGQPGDGTATSPSTGTPLAGITFKVYPVTLGSDGVFPVSGTLTLDNYSNPTKFADGAGVEFGVGAGSSQTTDSAGLATFSALPMGVYLVVEQTSSLVSAPTAPFVVAVPMTDPAGTGWLTDVNVYPKSEQLSFDKTVSRSAVNVGGSVTYTLTPQLPSNIAAVTNFSVIDQFDVAIRLIGATDVVVATSAAGLATGTPLSEPAECVVTLTTGNGTTTGPMLELTLTPAGIAKLAAGSAGTPYLFMQITQPATVANGILTSGVVTNQAQLNFTNQYGEAKTINSSNPNDPGNPAGTTDIHTATISITKVDAGNNALKLPGASFKIASSPANAAAGNFMRRDTYSGTILDYGDPYYNGGPGDWVVTTDQNGLASFAGIADYTGLSNAPTYSTYYLVETQAPQGYNLVPNPIPVTFTFDTSSGTNPTYNVAVTVTNNRGLILPMTGGAGTIAFTVGGAVLVGAAMILLVGTTKRRAVAQS